MKKDQKQSKKEDIWKHMKKSLEQLPHTDEDLRLLQKLWKGYSRKKKVTSGRPQTIAGALIWIYARLNFLSNEDKSWSQKNVAKATGVSVATLSSKSSRIMDDMNIQPLWDQKYTRHTLQEANPLFNMVVEPESGLIFQSNDPEMAHVPRMNTVQQKEDYVWDALDAIERHDLTKAKRLLTKALDIDEDFIHALWAMSILHNYEENITKAKKYIDQAYEQVCEQHPSWIQELMWGMIEHRPLMRVIADKAMRYHDDGDVENAAKIYRELLICNPHDNQGIRFLCAALYAGKSGEYVNQLTDEGNQKQDWSALDNLLTEQNKKHQFWEEPDFE